MKKKTVVIGFLGTRLDRRAKGEKRWQRWRPSVALCQQGDLHIDRFELLHSDEFRKLAYSVSADIQLTSPSTTVRCIEVTHANPWDFEEVYGLLHDFARHYPFDTETEDYLIHITTGTHVAQICWFLLTESHYIPARLLQSGPRINPETQTVDPRGTYDIVDLDLSRYDAISTRFARESADSITFLKSGIATRNATFNRVIQNIEKVALRSTAPVLLIGPTGAGKSFLARRIFELRQQRHQVKGRFVEVNCATLRGDMAMSNLFGHVKGAFTGAQQERTGLLRAAEDGILFLDEIGELGADEQAMLLKAIEEKKFFPYGSDSEVHSNFMLIAGTHRNLRQRVQQGLFREDLFARINLWTFDLPSLAERLEDIEPNLDFELERYGQQHQCAIRLNREAREKFLAFATAPSARWNGNFRELSAAVTRMATLAEKGCIDTAIVEEEILRLQSSWQSTDTETHSAPLRALLGEQWHNTDYFDRLQLQQVVSVCQQCKNLSEAGRRLFNISRLEKKSVNDADRLKKYLARFSLQWEDLRPL